MHPYDEMKSWVGFTAEDEARLRALWPLAQPELPRLADLFYSRILAHPTASAVLADEAQVERLKGTLRRWSEELLQGPWDDAYYQRRERIGRVHVEVGLPSRYMFTAMSVWRDALCELAHAHLAAEDAHAACRAIGRVTDMDLAIMTGTYMEGREAKQVSTLQELIVSHMPVTVLLLNGDGRVTAATRPGTRLFGRHDVVGRPYQEALPTALTEAADLDRHLARALASRHEITLNRVDANLDGLDRNFRISLVPLDNPHACVLLHVEELTEAVHTEGRLVRSESLAQLGALSAAVAHELRNPLAGISGALQVITRTLPDTDRRKPIMDKIEQQVRRLDALVTDLLDFARPTEARMKELRLEEVVRNGIEFVQRDHPRVRLQLDGAGPAWADPNLVQQIVLNLVLNAIQAMDGQGEVRLVLAAGRVIVSDEGPGIPAANTEKIFAPFFTTRTRGTGLGLAICRKAAMAMGGRLALGQGPLKGATFVLELQQGPGA